jgi:hypothetical protein
VIARAGPSNVASAPSPVNLVTSPRALATYSCTTPLCASRAAAQAASPRAAARSVDPTMSVNNTVDNTRFVDRAAREPVTNDSISSRTRSESPANHTLSCPSNSTKRACGMRSARTLGSSLYSAATRATIS